MSETSAVKNDCIKTIRACCQDDYRAVVGISGGVNSAVTAALCVEALGKERVLGVLMPNCVQKNLDLAMLTVTSLGIAHEMINIMDAMGGLQRTLPFPITREERRCFSRQVRRMVLDAVCERRHGRLIRPDTFAISAADIAPLGEACGLSNLLTGKALNSNRDAR